MTLGMRIQGDAYRAMRVACHGAVLIVPEIPDDAWRLAVLRRALDKGALPWQSLVPYTDAQIMSALRRIFPDRREVMPRRGNPNRGPT